MMSKNRQYDNDFKVQAVKLAKEIGTEKAAKELNVPSNTLYGWVKKAKVGGLDIGLGERSPEDALNIAEENQQLKKKIKAMEKEIKRLNEMNEFLECSCWQRTLRRRVRMQRLPSVISDVMQMMH